MNKYYIIKYHLKREVWETIAVCIAFIGLLMIIAGIEMMVF